MGHQAIEPRAVAEHFARFGQAGSDREHAIVTQVFTPDRGWKTYPINKRISGAWARQAKALGVTAVAVQSAGRIADFRIEELTRRG